MKSLATSLVLLAAMSGASSASCIDDSCVRIGTYNIKLFGGENAPANTDPEIGELARRIDKTMKLDAVVLTEIDVGSQSWAKLQTELKSRGFEVAAQGAFGGSDPGRKQHVVVIYRTTRVAISGNSGEVPIATTYDDGSGCKYDSVRPPLAVGLKASDFEFTLIGVHLKSEQEVGNGDQCDDDIRKYQSKEIVSWIDAQPDPKRNIIVAGDINSAFAEDEFAPFRDAGYTTAISNLPKWSGKVSYLGSSAYQPGLIDHVIYKNGAAKFVANSGFALKIRPKDLAAYKETQSDHAPVAADFRTDGGTN